VTSSLEKEQHFLKEKDKEVNEKETYNQRKREANYKKQKQVIR